MEDDDDVDFDVEYNGTLGESCPRCGHEFSPHMLVATLVSPQLGGLIFCQEPGCMCQDTWKLRGEPEPYFPDGDTVEHLRAFAQETEN